jgi:VWFA-related protein
VKIPRAFILFIPAAVLLAVWFPVSSFPLQSGPSQSGDFRISTNVDLVLLDVSVRDSKGGYASDLSQDNFHIEENGIPQKITSFSNADLPVAAGLLLDDSGSMKPKRDDVNTAGLTFVDASNPNDQIFVVNFNDQVRFGLPDDVPFTDSIDQLRVAMSRHRAEGKTVLYDAIAKSLQHLYMGERSRKTLVIVSDGGDNASRLRQPDAMELIERSHATIYTVGIFEPDDFDRNPAVLRRIAAVSGGQCFLLNDVGEVIPTLRSIANDIRHRYTIGYIPDRGTNTMPLRKIRVTVNAPNHGHLTVRTRSSYLAPG